MRAIQQEELTMTNYIYVLAIDENPDDFGECIDRFYYSSILKARAAALETLLNRYKETEEEDPEYIKENSPISTLLEWTKPRDTLWRAETEEFFGILFTITKQEIL